jgi:hypothetical protein
MDVEDTRDIRCPSRRAENAKYPDLDALGYLAHVGQFLVGAAFLFPRPGHLDFERQLRLLLRL